VYGALLQVECHDKGECNVSGEQRGFPQQLISLTFQQQGGIGGSGKLSILQTP